mgnify:CR=1 FL=1
MRITLRTRVRLGPAAGEVTGPQADRVRAHLGRVGDARVADLMHRCHLTAPEVGDLLREGALRVATGLRRCETCRAPVASGNLCPACRARLAAPLIGLVTQHEEEVEDPPLSEQEAAVKRALAVARAMRRAQVQRSAAEEDHADPDPVRPPAASSPEAGEQASRALARSRMWSRLRRHAS